MRNWILAGIPAAILIGGLTHSAFEFSRSNIFIGILTPVNESVWEHLKMSFWLPLIWWIAGYFVLSRRGGIRPEKWFTACAAALYIALLFIVSSFYLYTGALGCRSPVMDIVLFVLGIAAAQAAACQIYKHAELKKSCIYYSLFAIAVLTAAFVAFTFAPPRIPLFMDWETGSYGI
ncbi:MAG: DUF6512 family protein [Oscillospiraceae bacterium]